jgi:hypothetical protein
MDRLDDKVGVTGPYFRRAHDSEGGFGEQYCEAQIRIFAGEERHFERQNSRVQRRSLS